MQEYCTGLPENPTGLLEYKGLMKSIGLLESRGLLEAKGRLGATGLLKDSGRLKFSRLLDYRTVESSRAPKRQDCWEPQNYLELKGCWNIGLLGAVYRTTENYRITGSYRIAGSYWTAEIQD